MILDYTDKVGLTPIPMTRTYQSSENTDKILNNFNGNVGYNVVGWREGEGGEKSWITTWSNVIISA